MRQAREHAPEVIEKLLSIVRNPKAAHRDVIQAAIALLDRGCGRPVIPVFRGGDQIGLIEDSSGMIGGEATALLRSAARNANESYRETLLAELARLDAQEAESRAAAQDELDEARRARANGQDISPMMGLLLSTKDAKE